MTIQVDARPVGYWELSWEGWKYGWDYGHKAASAPWTSDPTLCRAANTGLPFYTDYTVIRGLLKIDLTSVPLGTVITEATLFVWHCSATAEAGNMEVVLVNGTNIPEDNSGYGVMLGRTVNCGSITVPMGVHANVDYEFVLNTKGLLVLQNAVGGYAYFGVRIATDINDDPQNNYNWWHFIYDSDAYIELDYYLKRSALPRARQETMVRVLSSARTLSPVRSIDP